MKTITGVPESITQQAYIDLVSAVGIEPKDVRKLEFRIDGIYAEVFERAAGGGFVISGDDIVVNTIWIPVKDES